MTQIGIFFWFGLVFSPFSRGNVESYYIFRKNAFQTQGMAVFHLYFYGMYKKNLSPDRNIFLGLHCCYDLFIYL